jgi:acyl-CoA hydrolase
MADRTRGSGRARPAVRLPGPEVRVARTVFPDQTNHLGTLLGGQAL